MKSILYKYMSKFTSLTEEQQLTIANEIKSTNLKKEQSFLDKEMFLLNAILC